MCVCLRTGGVGLARSSELVYRELFTWFFFWRFFFRFFFRKRLTGVQPNFSDMRRCVRSLQTSSRPLQRETTAQANSRRMMEVILVRHGESEGNIAHRRGQEGDFSLYSGDFMKVSCP